MKTKYSKCRACPAYHLLTDERIKEIEYWEYKRDNYLRRIKKIKLILIGESMPDERYFYDINTEYNERGLRYSLKEEFGKTDLSDGLFLESMGRKGIVLFDCALCPLFYVRNDYVKKQAATHCFLSINIEKILELKDIPIVTIFPANRGWTESELPLEIKSRIVGKFRFTSQSGLSLLYEQIKNQ